MQVIFLGVAGAAICRFSVVAILLWYVIRSDVHSLDVYLLHEVLPTSAISLVIGSCSVC
jgi:hypothetical protein